MKIEMLVRMLSYYVFTVDNTDLYLLVGLQNTYLKQVVSLIKPTDLQGEFHHIMLRVQLHAIIST